MTARMLIPPLLTPLLPDEQVDRDSLARLVDHTLSQGVTGIFVLGSSGEGPLLTLEQRRTVVRTAGEVVDGHAPLYVGVSECSVGRVRELMQALNTPAVTAFVLTVPFYGNFDDPELQAAFFETVAGEAPRPLILYNIPQAVHATVAPTTVARLAAHPQIIGIKDSAGDLIPFQQMLKLRERHDFTVFQGAEQLAGLSLLAGADGLVAGMCNLVPGWFADLLAAARDHDVAAALRIQARINALWPLHTHGHWLSCLKTAASLLGLCGPTVSAPLPPLSADATGRIRLLLEEHDLI